MSEYERYTIRRMFKTHRDAMDTHLKQEVEALQHEVMTSMKPTLELYWERLPDGRYRLVKNGHEFQTSPAQYNTNEEMLVAVLTALTSEERGSHASA